jgi:hypothetical protein
MPTRWSRRTTWASSTAPRASDEAELLWTDALARRRHTLGNEHPQTLFSIVAMADLELARRQTDAAAAYVEEVNRVAEQRIAEARRLLLDDAPDPWQPPILNPERARS